MGKISHFYNPGIAVDQEEGERQGNKLIKKALLLVSGSHKDSKKRPHVFEVDRIHQIADNTNRVLSEYGRIPLIKDHNKTSDSTIGDLEGEVYTKVITRADLPDPRLTDLIGKTGIFTNNLVVKSKQAIQGFMEGVHRTISPGIDVDTDEIREISVTPLPAIKGLMAFHKGEANSLRKFALTLDEAEQETDDLDQLKEQFEEKGELFWTVVESVSSAEEDALQGADPKELLFQAVNDYVERIVELLQLNEEPEEEDPYGQMQPQQGQAPMRQGYPSTRGFSMADMEASYAEFAKRGSSGGQSMLSRRPKKQNTAPFRPAVGGQSMLQRPVATPQQTTSVRQPVGGQSLLARRPKKVKSTAFRPATGGQSMLARQSRTAKQQGRQVANMRMRSRPSASSVSATRGGSAVVAATTPYGKPGYIPRIANSAKRAGTALTTSTGRGGFGGIKGRLGATWRSGAVGKLGIGGAGLVGAAGVAGAGLAGYRALTGSRKRKMTITRNYY